MAKKQESIIQGGDFFMKIGMAEGAQFVPDYSAITGAITKGAGMIDKQLKQNKLNEEMKILEGNKKREALMEKFPNGVEIKKAGREWGSMPTDYLRSKRTEYDKWSRIAAEGADHPQYDEAMDNMDMIRVDIEDMSDQFEQIALVRQNAFDMSDGDGLSASSTQWDQMNLNNIANMNTEALQPRIEYIDGRSVLVLKDAQGNDINAEDYGQKLGRKYNHKLRDDLDAAQKEVRSIGSNFAQTNKGAWDPKASLKDIQRMARDKDAVVDLMYQEDLIDDFIKLRNPGISDEEVYYMRDFYKEKPGFKEDIVEWFIKNEYDTLLNEFKIGKDNALTGGVQGKEYKQGGGRDWNVY